MMQHADLFSIFTEDYTSNFLHCIRKK